MTVLPFLTWYCYSFNIIYGYNIPWFKSSIVMCLFITLQVFVNSTEENLAQLEIYFQLNQMSNVFYNL